MVVGSALYLDGQVIPCSAFRVAWNTGRHPRPFLIIENIPLISVGDAALMAINKTLAVEELIDVELQSFGGSEIIAIEIHVIGEIVQSRHQTMVSVERALRGERPDEGVVKQGIGIRGGSSYPEDRGISAHRGIAHPLGHRERDAIAG